MALFFLAGVIGIFAEAYDLKWLGIIILSLIVISMTLLLISWIMPGALILLGVPWLARSWLRGINPIAISATPWEQLSGLQRILTYFWSVTISGFMLLAIIGFILQAIRK